MGSEGYKDKSALAAAWGYTRRAGLSNSIRAHWASRRGKKLLLGVFLVMLSLLCCFFHLIRISSGLVRNGGISLSLSGSSTSGSRHQQQHQGLDDDRIAPLAEEKDGEAPELAPIDWAAKNIEDKWEHPVARRLHLTPADLLEDKEVRVPVRLPVGVEVVDAEAPGEGKDLELELCQFDLAKYHRLPERFPMEHDLVDHFCGPKRRSRMLASELAADEEAGRQLQPTGFIFHESRVGSTLVANMLGSVPVNLVYSEPHVPFAVLHECDRHGCTHEEKVRLLRQAVLSMGRSHHHDHFFIKFQSSFVPYMHLVLEAFPDTPWVFIYRDPVEVMVSNFQRKGKGGGPCVRGRRNPPKAVQEILGTDRKGAMKAGDEAYCAAHLAMLCNTALEHLKAGNSKGYALSYETLVADVMDAVIPGHFGVALAADERARMKEVSEVYSKSRGNIEDFEGDAEEKHAEASGAVEAAADTYLHEPTERLGEVSKRGRKLLEANADLRAQEARVYERTGSRFFSLPYCPDEPEYPPEVPIVDMVANWNPDDIALPARHYNTLCRLDYQKDYAKALRYRDAEVPFVLVNVPDFDATVKKWNEPGYLEEQLGDDKYHTEVSKNNHFLYYRLGRNKRGKLNGYVPPTKSEKWTYAHWLYEARRARNISAENAHYYFRVSDNDNPVVRQDLTIFSTEEPSLIMKEPELSRGIHCRFGMRGVIAEGHFDASRNMVALVSGTRRWILAHPRECKHAYMLPMGHPSARHSQVDWSHPDLDKWPDFKNMKGHEVVLTAGEVLFVPAWWIHYIANLDINIQCNSRSGDSEIGLADLEKCGFFMGHKPKGH